MVASTGQSSVSPEQRAKRKGKGVSALAEASRRRAAATEGNRKTQSHDTNLLKRKYGRAIGARYDGSGQLIPADYMMMARREDVDRKVDSRQLKKRKSQRKPEADEPSAPKVEPVKEEPPEPPAQAQTIEVEMDDDDDDESDDSDEEWEEVDLEQSKIDFVLGGDAQAKPDNITIALDKDEFDAEAKAKRKRRAAITPKLSSEDREKRQTIHKIHLAALVAHVSIRNKWCSDFTVRQFFRKLIPDRIKQELHPQSAALENGNNENMSQMVLTRKLLDGLRHLMELWKKQFRVKGVCGLRMTSWADVYSRERKVESKIDRAKFIKLMKKFRGSRDLGAQGFCALLRAADVDARLVCSLQPLDFTSNVPTGQLEDALASPKDASVSQDQSDEVVQSSCPVYWVEVWDAYAQRWIAIDPIVLGIVEPAYIHRKSKLEPPLNDKFNMMRYVIAFDDEGASRDVTRRYAYYYNAKTIKKRITKTPEGEEWYNELLATHRRKYDTDRDRLEDLEMENRSQSEEIPSSIQDFKGHPL